MQSLAVVVIPCFLVCLFFWGLFWVCFFVVFIYVGFFSLAGLVWVGFLKMLFGH